jgi:site-specific recombinase XerD
MRQANAPSVELLIRDSGGVSGEAKPFAEHVDHIMARAIENERPSQNTLDDWNNDALRVKEFFNNIPACDIELEHVNAYIKHYHSDSSANVQNRKVSFLKNLFSYAVDESLMFDNPATRKKMRRTEEKKRQRLSLDNFKAIRRAANPGYDRDGFSIADDARAP